ncbi:MAG: ABC transporter substrate binding protein [Chloroflexi bacterium]|nr:ABC transporter substrate binding protein [Chloroflexota bacterium]
MFKRLLILLCAFLLAQSVMGQAEDKPTIAMLRFGSFFSFTYVENAVLDTLLANALVTEAEHATLHARENLEGERINVYWNDANFDFTAVNTIIEDALDRGADALIVLSTPTAQAAVNITSDMDDPPIVLFTSVFNPYEAGIAQAPCVKPSHVAGIESVTLYEDIVPLLLLQDPDLKMIGTIYSSAETSGRLGAEAIIAAAEAHGLTVEVAAIANLPDMTVAANALVDKGVEAFLLPSDLLTMSGLPVITQIAIENGLPVYHSTSNTINLGATVSAGAGHNSLQGSLIGAMLAGHFRGELDIASTGIGMIDLLSVGLNLDVAAEQGIEFTDSLMERSHLLLKDGGMSGRALVAFLESLGMDEETMNLVLKAIAEAQTGGGEINVDLPENVLAALSAAIASQRRTEDVGAILDSLHCTPEMIAEQQAALDASE